MQLLIEPNKQQSFRSLYDDRIASIPQLIAGGILPISLVRLQRVQTEFDARVFTPLDWTNWTDLRVAIGGTYPFQLPVAGTWPITFEAETSALLIPANPSAIDIQAALDLIDAIDDAGGIDVTGENGFFVLTFRENGARNLIAGDPAELVPLSILDFQTATAGDIDTRAVQTLRIRQNAGASASIDDDGEPGEIAIETIQAGSAGHNHKVRVTLPGTRWGGAWTFSRGAVESELIIYLENEAEIKDDLERMSNIGIGNVDVVRESEDSYLFEFIGDLAGMAIADLAVDGDTLKLMATKTGALDMDVPGVDYLLGCSDSRVVRLEVEGIPPDGDAPVKLLSRDVVLRRSVG